MLAIELISDPKPLRIRIKVVQAEIAPAILHDQAPGLFGST